MEIGLKLFVFIIGISLFFALVGFLVKKYLSNFFDKIFPSIKNIFKKTGESQHLRSPVFFVFL